MNDIKKAIECFKFKIELNDAGIENLRRATERGESNYYTPEAMSNLRNENKYYNLAIQALEKQERESGWISAKFEVPINNDDVIVIDDVGGEYIAHYSETKEAWFKNCILMVNDVVFWKYRPKEEVL